MGCVVSLLGLIAPRFVIVLLWLFSDWFSSVSENFLLPLLGFIFLPYSFLWYSAVVNWYGGEWGVMQSILMVIAVLMDLGASGDTVRRR